MPDADGEFPESDSRQFRGLYSLSTPQDHKFGRQSRLPKGAVLSKLMRPGVAASTNGAVSAYMATAGTVLASSAELITSPLRGWRHKAIRLHPAISRYGSRAGVSCQVSSESIVLIFAPGPMTPTAFQSGPPLETEEARLCTGTSLVQGDGRHTFKPYMAPWKKSNVYEASLLTGRKGCWARYRPNC